MISRRGKVAIAVLISGLAVSSAFAVFDHFYLQRTDFNGVYRISPDSFYSGKPLPPSYNMPAAEVLPNLTGNFTAHYSLAEFPYTMWENNSAGQFKFGLTFGFWPNGSDNITGIPFNSEVNPTVWLGLLSEHLNFSGYLGIKAVDITAYSSLPYVSPIDFGNASSPSPWSMYVVYEHAYFNQREVNVGTLGNVYFIHPVKQFPGPGNALFTLYTGQYYLVLKLGLYSITPFGTHFIEEVNISEPWVHVT